MVCNEYNYNITRLSWLAIYLRIFLSADCLTGFFFSVKHSMNVLIHYDSLSFFTAIMLSMYFQYCIHMNTIYLFFCGSERNRTDDLLNANQALSQLSYGPMICSDTNSMMTICSHRLSVGPSGLEPPTSRLSGVCSNQLSYRPMVLLICQLHDMIVLSKQRTEAVLFIPSSIAEYLLRDSLIFYAI